MRGSVDLAEGNPTIVTLGGGRDKEKQIPRCARNDTCTMVENTADRRHRVATGCAYFGFGFRFGFGLRFRRWLWSCNPAASAGLQVVQPKRLRLKDLDHVQFERDGRQSDRHYRASQTSGPADSLDMGGGRDKYRAFETGIHLHLSGDGNVRVGAKVEEDCLGGLFVPAVKNGVDSRGWADFPRLCIDSQCP